MISNLCLKMNAKLGDKNYQNNSIILIKLFLRWDQHDPRPRDASQDLPRADHVHGSNHHPPARW